MVETRVVNLRLEPYDVYIGRAGKGQDGYFGNPHRVGVCPLCGTTHARGEAVAAFKRTFWWRVNCDPAYRARVQALRGKRLGCFCKPAACHGDVIVAWLAAGCPLKATRIPTQPVTSAAPAVIRAFRGPCAILSSFAPSAPTPSVEHHYQAAKTTDPAWIARILAAPTPAAARRLGRRVPLRPDWDRVKLEVIAALLRQKFADPALRARLLATGTAVLQEGNWWGDTFWGVEERTGVGENQLGRLLMELRDGLRESARASAGHRAPSRAR